MTAFDGIGRKREGGAGKADERHPSGQLALNLLDGCQNVGERLARLEAPDRLQVGLCPQRPLDRGTFALEKVEGNAHGFERQEQVGEEDRRVDVNPPNGLQSDRGRQVGGAANLEQGISLAELAISLM